MGSTQRTITIPNKLWKEWTVFMKSHPEITFSGWIQQHMRNTLSRNVYIKCKYFKDGLCQTNSLINECSKMLYGVCILEAD